MAKAVAELSPRNGSLRRHPGWEQMSFRDYKSEFERLRNEAIKVQKAAAQGILCRARYTPAKREAMLKEVERLTRGFVKTSGFLSNLRSEIKTPSWQKAEKWVDPNAANICYQCKRPFSITSKKINCRIGGQVFCKECGGSDSIVIYREDKKTEPKWTINGKGEVDKKKIKSSFELYAVCSGCASDLEIILVEEKELARQRSLFMDNALAVYQSVSTLQRKLDDWLPQYQQEVDALEGVTNITTIDDSVRKRLAKLHLDMYHVLSAVKYRNDNELLKLTPEHEDVHRRILQRLQSGTSQRYDEHYEKFEDAQKKLFECFQSPVVEILVEVQRESSRKSMESVYIEIRQFKEGLSHHTEDIDPSLLESMTEIVKSIREEFQPFLKSRETFDKHFEVAMIDKRSQIEISQSLEKDSDKRIIIISQCSTVINSCYYRLRGEALDLEFQQTKQLLDKTRQQLESAIAQYNSKCSSAPPSC